MLKVYTSDSPVSVEMPSLAKMLKPCTVVGRASTNYIKAVLILSFDFDLSIVNNFLLL